MKTVVSKRFSLTCKFKQSAVELVITDKNTGAVQLEIIPVTFADAANQHSDSDTKEEIVHGD